METLTLTNNIDALNSNIYPINNPKDDNGVSTSKPFIAANTIDATLDEIKECHLIPVFAKDNQPAISQSDLISLTMDITQHIFQRETILNPSIRISHPIKGRIPDAKDKPAHLLLEEEKTIYYERMAFIIEIPSISSTINGNALSLTVGGIKAHHLDNLYSRKGSEEHFKLFIGFQNKVCTNMCVWSDGLQESLKVRSVDELTDAIVNLITSYQVQAHLDNLNIFTNHHLTENQFANLIGRARMYNHLSPKQRKDIPVLAFGDTLVGMVVKDYYSNESFCKEEDGSINLWKLYNLFTSANKSSYIDTFLSRGLNAYTFLESIANAMENKQHNWFLD